MDATTPPKNLTEWIACALFLIVGLNYIFDLVSKLKSKPQASDVQREASQTFATKVELEKHLQQDEAVHNQLFAKIGGSERGVEARLVERINKLESATTNQLKEMGSDSVTSRRDMHKDIEAMKADIEGIKRDIAHNADQLKVVAEQQNNLPNQIITLLLNTGAIK
jgi:hypothetical protein